MSDFGFYYEWKENSEPEWGDWRFLWNTQFSLQIIASTTPLEVVDIQNPRIEWVSELNPRGVMFKIPTLYHVPVCGKNYQSITNVKGNVIIPVLDFNWVHMLQSKQDDGDSSTNHIITLDQLYLENRLETEQIWLDTYVDPLWKEYYERIDNLSEMEKRQMVALSQINGEWKTAIKVSQMCSWSETIIKYDDSYCNAVSRCSLTQSEKDSLLCERLWSNDLSYFEVWYTLLDLHNSNPSWDRSRLLFNLSEKAIEWQSQLTTGRWVQRRTINDYYVSVYKLLETYKNKNKRLSYLFPLTLDITDKNTRTLFTQGCLEMIPSLASFPCEKGDLLYSNKDIDFVPSSSGITVYPENPKWYLVNVRLVNYRILPNGAYVTMRDGQINSYYNGISKNEFYIMDRDTLCPITNVRPMSEQFITTHREEEIAIVGLEDIRLVHGTDIDVRFYGVTKSFSYNDCIRIITGKYDIEHAAFKDTVVIHPPYEENSCEKNWTWCGMERFIYRWHPIEIGYLDRNHNRLVIDESIPSPSYFNEFRGSSPCLLWKGFSFFTVHSVSFGENGRKYIHYIVVLDLNSTDHKVVAVSSPFCFEDIQIEYTIGLDIYKGKMLFLYSTRDCTGRYIRIPLYRILDMLYYPDPNMENKFKHEIYQDII